MIGAAIIGMGWWGRTILKTLINSTVIAPARAVDPLGEACYPVALEEKLTNVRAFEATQRSVSSAIEMI